MTSPFLPFPADDFSHGLYQLANEELHCTEELDLFNKKTNSSLTHWLKLTVQRHSSHCASEDFIMWFLTYVLKTSGLGSKCTFQCLQECSDTKGKNKHSLVKVKDSSDFKISHFACSIQAFLMSLHLPTTEFPLPHFDSDWDSTCFFSYFKNFL